MVSLDEYRNTVTSEPVMPAAASDPGPFVAPRLYVSNVTIERLTLSLRARPQGMLMLADELADCLSCQKGPVIQADTDNEF